MPVSPTYPGVYVQEVPSGVRTIAGVSTSIGMFIGTAKKGPVNSPQRCLNYTSFKNQFGDDSSYGDLAQYVKLFFLNGGTDCYVARIARTDANAPTARVFSFMIPNAAGYITGSGSGGLASLLLQSGSGSGIDIPDMGTGSGSGFGSGALVLGSGSAPYSGLTLTAKDPGVFGNLIRAELKETNPAAKTFTLILYRSDGTSGSSEVRSEVETWPYLSMNSTSQFFAPTYITNNSLLVNAALWTGTADSLGIDGTPVDATDYDNLYPIIDREVDLFNLMVLAPTKTLNASGVFVDGISVDDLYGAASTFCFGRRAFLIMDSPMDLDLNATPRKRWKTAQEAVNSQTGTPPGVSAYRLSLVKDYSAIFFPRITIDDNGTSRNIGPSGAIAGLMARTDGTRGVWKAPAGTEANILGITGLEQRFSDSENGILNPQAINTLRIFPSSGIVNWGARTSHGADDDPSDYKYIPVRRLALFMEESLYRGLKWVVFEPNDEPLWAQIRLNVGAFMHDLFRNHAFQGATPKDAYFVKCDSETTTQTDINNGKVNIWVGFAPLKPAEFVILYLQQMAGNIQV